MLDDDKKRLIEDEERYRRDIAKRLDSDLSATETDVKNLSKDVWAKISEALNSNFGLWLLSSVFLSGGAALYQITQHHYETKLSKEKELLTCEFEIANRLNSIKFLISRAKTIGDAQFALTPVTKSFGAVTTEYEHVNIAVLYFKIFQLTGQLDKRQANFVRDLEERNLWIQGQNSKALLDDTDRKKLIDLIDTLHQYDVDAINSRK